MIDFVCSIGLSMLPIVLVVILLWMWNNERV